MEADLQGLRVIGKDLEREEMFIPLSISAADNGIVIVATKNPKVLARLDTVLNRVRSGLGELPVTLFIDDEADQASLDTQTSRRAKDPFIDSGRINDLIRRVRSAFKRHTFLQVTATPQALFLQDANQFRPEFTIILEPGKGYVGGNTFFSIIENEAEEAEEENERVSLIRYIMQSELDEVVNSSPNRVLNIGDVPASLRESLAIFFIGATIKYLLGQGKKPSTELVYSYLCHISEKKADHEKAYKFISRYYEYLAAGLIDPNKAHYKPAIIDELKKAFDELVTTVDPAELPEFETIIEELTNYITSVNMQILNSDKEQDQPNYTRRYNILIGGTKLARGVTIKNLLVTYYGRRAKSTNMDTMLQHARMYGYRQSDLDVTRLYVTRLVETRFRLITESEHALRKVITDYPNQEYQTIYIGEGVRATRSNVLNPNNIGAYAAGSSYFPKKPIFEPAKTDYFTAQLDDILATLYPEDFREAVQITIDKMIELVKLPQFDQNGSGLWQAERISKALTTLKSMYNNKGFLVVRRDRNLGPSKSRGNSELGSVLAGGSSGKEGLTKYGRTDAPTLYMLRNKGLKWNKEAGDSYYFWIPALQFPDGRFALTFNFDD